MHRSIIALVIASGLGLPLAAVAQPVPPSGPMGSPSPEMRAKMEAVHAQAKTDAYAALTPDHRTQVAAITGQVVNGTLRRRAAAEQIDALLTDPEKQAVLAVMQKVQESMGPPPGAPTGAPAPAGAPAAPPANAGSGGPGGGPGGPGGPWHRRAPTPGGFLIMVSMTPEQMQAMRGMHGARPAPSATP